MILADDLALAIEGRYARNDSGYPAARVEEVVHASATAVIVRWGQFECWCSSPTPDDGAVFQDGAFLRLVLHSPLGDRFVTSRYCVHEYEQIERCFEDAMLELVSRQVWWMSGKNTELYTLIHRNARGSIWYADKLEKQLRWDGEGDFIAHPPPAPQPPRTVVQGELE